MASEYTIKEVRADAILTTGYIAGTVIDNCERHNQLMLFLKYTKGSLTSFQVKVEYSYDGVTFYQQTFVAVSDGVSTAKLGSYTFAPAANANLELEIPIKCYQVRVSVKGTGTVTNSSLKVDAVLGST